MNEKGKRLTDEYNRCFTVSIGDLANCAKEGVRGDVKCLEKVGDWIDVLLMGNHEIPYFDKRNLWSRFHYHEEVHRELLRIDSEKRLKPAIICGETLISHAGWDRDNHPYIHTAKEAYDSIMNHLEFAGWSDRYFSAVGSSRGGRGKHGGILWEDFQDLRSPFPQIVGHTARKRIRTKKNAICIDTGHSGIPTVIEV